MLYEYGRIFTFLILAKIAAKSILSSNIKKPMRFENILNIPPGFINLLSRVFSISTLVLQILNDKYLVSLFKQQFTQRRLSYLLTVPNLKLQLI